MARFRELLTEGKIGDVRLGMPSETVEQYLGPPDDRSVKKRPIEILKFGSVELAFEFIPDSNHSRLIAIAIYFYNPKRSLPPSIAFEDWMPTADTTEADFRGFLVTNPKSFQVDGETKHLVLDSGASIVFIDEHLHSVHFHRVDKATPGRQVSVSLPESTLSQLRARAARENVSLQVLLEKVLSKTA